MRLVLVLMQPHLAVRTVVVEDADVRGQTRSGGGRHRRRQRDQVDRQLRRRPAIMIAAHRLVPVCPRVPVTSQTDHPDPHLTAPTNRRHIPPRGAGADRPAPVGERALRVEREKPRQMHGIRTDLDTADGHRCYCIKSVVLAKPPASSDF